MVSIQEVEEEEEKKRISRRRLLKSVLLLSAVGLGTIVLGGAVTRATDAAPPSKGTLQRASSYGSASAPSPSPTPALRTPSVSAPTTISGSSVKVKVVYFQMPQTVIDVEDEYFVLQSPAHFSNLQSSIVQEHPLLSTMWPTMMKLVDGVLAQPGTRLNDGDEVDLIPAFAGG